MVRLVLAALAVALAIVPAAAAQPSGSLAVTASAGAASVTASYLGVPGKSHPEVVVQCSGYVGTELVSSGVPAVFSGLPAGACSATLFYYTWQGQRETGSVVLAEADFAE